MADRFEGMAISYDAPAIHGFSITPNDSTDLSEVTRAIWVGGAGDLALVLMSGATLTLPSVPAGTLIPVRAARILATGTDATGLAGLV